MTFLSGELLAFLGALGLPILVHLLNLRRRRTRDIPTLRFLLEIESTRLRRVKLTRWLLLLVRMLLLTALVLAFARPLLKGARAFLPLGGQASALVLLLDDSASSRLPSEGAATVWERVREAAAQRLVGRGPDDQIWLISLSRPTEVLGPLSADAARIHLGQWTPTWGRARLDDALQEAVKLLEEAPPVGQQLVLFSDLRLPLPTGWADRLPPALSRVVVQVPSEQEQAGLVELRPQGSLSIEGKPLDLRCAVEGDGQLAGLYLSLELDGETRAHQAFSANEDGAWRLERELSLALPPGGWHKGWLHLDGDAVDVDNALPFVLHVESKRRVGVAGAPPALLRVLKAALLPDERYRQGMDVQVLGEGATQVPREIDLAVVVVGGPEPAEFSATLRSLAASGVGLFLLPHPEASAAELKRHLDALGFMGAAQPISGEWAVDQADRQHALLGSILEPTGGAPLERVRVERLLEVPEATTGTWRSLVYAGSHPLLLARQGQGSSLLFLTTTADARWSGLASSGFLAPLLQQGLRWLKDEERVPSALDCGESGQVELPAQSAGQDWQLRKDGAVWRCVAQGRRRILDCPPLPEPGHYELVVDERVVGLVAARVPARESTMPIAALDAWSEEDAGAWTLRRLQEDGEKADTDLGPWLLALALLLLALEGWLAAGRRSS